jgi:hypothetical protein
MFKVQIPDITTILVLAATSVLATQHSVASAQPAENTRSVVAMCGVNLVFFGFEKHCAATYSLSPSISVGARYVDTLVMDDEFQTALGIVEWRPMQGSFHIDAGFGTGRWRESASLDWRWGQAAEVRMGNRWTIPGGLTLGMQYAGIHAARGGDQGFFVLIGPELGWRF